MYIDINNPVPHTPSAYAFPLLIKHLWLTPLTNSPEREIVYRDRARFTYRESYARIGRLASALTGLGVKPGMTVAVMDWDTHRYFESYFAIPMMGCVLMTVNVRLSPRQLAYTLNHSDVDAILVNAEFLPLLTAIRDKLEKPVRLILMHDDEHAPDAQGLTFEGEYETLLAAASPDVDFPDFDEDTRATTFFTTGTTGEPKACYYSHRQLALHTLGVASWLGTAAAQGRVHREDVYMPITPLFHVHAWGLPYVATMLGLKQVYPGRYEAPMLLQLIRDEGVTFSHSVPTLLQMILEHPDSQKTDLSRLKMVIGGSALPQGLCREAIERGIDVFTGYGMSETAPVQTLMQLGSEEMVGDADEQAALRILTGYRLPLCDVRVVDDAMGDVPHDGKAQGEVVFRGPWLTQGYLHEPERSEELWRGGYLHSGDVASVDAKGRLQIRDRLKDVIKSGGEWVSSLALESLISKMPGVGGVAVIGVPDSKWGERPLALIVPHTGQTIRPQAIREQLQDLARQGVIARYAIPDDIRVVDELAKTSVGKLDKKALRAAYAGQ